MESTVLFQQVYGWKYWDLSSLTKKWVNGTATNYGVILWATNENTVSYDLRMYSSSTANNDSIRPKLEVTWSQTPRTVYFLKDHLGSIRATVQDTSTAPVCGYDDYDPWGYILAGRSVNSVCGPTSLVTRNKFTGKEWDDEFGLNWNYFGARYYDPQIGRWVARDPLAEKHPDFSPYNYALNNPLLYIDPDGQQIRAYVKYTAPPTFAEIKQNFVEKLALSSAYASGGLHQMAVGTLALGVLEAAGSALANLDPFGISGLANPILMAESAVVRGGAAVGEAAEAVSKTANVAEGVAGAASREISLINPNEVRFSQSSIKSTFKEGGSIDKLAEGLRTGKIDPKGIPPIRLVEKDGKLYTLDNRRLEAFKRAGVQVPYRMATPEEAAAEAWKFTTKNDGTSIRVREQQ